MPIGAFADPLARMLREKERREMGPPTMAQLAEALRAARNALAAAGQFHAAEYICDPLLARIEGAKP